jgi:hypothetical protein
MTVQATKKIPPVPLYIVPLKPKYLPQHPILEHPQPMLLPQRERPSFTHPYKQAKLHDL